MQALMNLLQTVCGDTFLYYSRRFQTWEEVTQNTRRGQPVSLQQPALFLYMGVGFGGGRIGYEQRGRGLPPVRTMDISIAIYALSPGSGTADGPDADTPGA